MTRAVEQVLGITARLTLGTKHRVDAAKTIFGACAGRGCAFEKLHAPDTEPLVDDTGIFFSAELESFHAITTSLPWTSEDTDRIVHAKAVADVTGVDGFTVGALVCASEVGEALAIVCAWSNKRAG